MKFPLCLAYTFLHPHDKTFDFVEDEDERKDLRARGKEAIGKIVDQISKNQIRNSELVILEQVGADSSDDSDASEAASLPDVYQQNRDALKKELRMWKRHVPVEPKQNRHYFLEHWKKLDELPILKKVVVYLAPIGFTTASLERSFSYTQYSFNENMSCTTDGGTVDDMYVIRNK